LSVINNGHDFPHRAISVSQAVLEAAGANSFHSMA
jgi:hypothetical protein